jgi:hypothetical protein
MQLRVEFQLSGVDLQVIASRPQQEVAKVYEGRERTRR